MRDVPEERRREGESNNMLLLLLVLACVSRSAIVWELNSDGTVPSSNQVPSSYVLPLLLFKSLMTQSKSIVLWQNVSLVGDLDLSCDVVRPSVSLPPQKQVLVKATIDGCSKAELLRRVKDKKYAGAIDMDTDAFSVLSWDSYDIFVADPSPWPSLWGVDSYSHIALRNVSDWQAWPSSFSFDPLSDAIMNGNNLTMLVTPDAPNEYLLNSVQTGSLTQCSLVFNTLSSLVCLLFCGVKLGISLNVGGLTVKRIVNVVTLLGIVTAALTLFLSLCGWQSWRLPVPRRIYFVFCYWPLCLSATGLVLVGFYFAEISMLQRLQIPALQKLFFPALGVIFVVWVFVIVCSALSADLRFDANEALVNMQLAFFQVMLSVQLRPICFFFFFFFF